MVFSDKTNEQKRNICIDFNKKGMEMERLYDDIAIIRVKQKNLKNI